MKKSNKALLFSLLIYPGAGHVFLKKYVIGISLIGITSFSLFYIMSVAIEQALLVIEQIQYSNVPTDVSSISDIVKKQLSGMDNSLFNTARNSIIIFWLVGIVDSYRQGLVQD